MDIKFFNALFCSYVLLSKQGLHPLKLHNASKQTLQNKNPTGGNSTNKMPLHLWDRLQMKT